MTTLQYSKYIAQALDLTRNHGRRTVAEYTNIEIPLVLPERWAIDYYTENYPRHKSKLDLRQAEFILCNSCESTIQITRHTSRTLPRLNQKYSTYHPQPLEYCKCRALAVLVDHRGTPRIYGEDNSFTLVTQPLGYERRYSEFDYQYIPKGLLEGFKRPRIVPEDVSMIPKTTKNLLLYSLLGNPKITYLIHPSSQHKFHAKHMESLIRYAYTFKIFIVTGRILYLPSGHYITLALIEPLLNTIGPDGNTLRHALGQPTEESMDFFYELICKTHGLPIVERLSYPIQTIGYLHLIKSDTTKWEFTKHHHYYASATVVNHLIKLKALVKQVVKQVGLWGTDVKNLQLFCKDYLDPQTLLIPPIDVYLRSRQLNPLLDPDYKDTGYLFKPRK